MNPLAADANFFNALIKADIPALDRLLADDFVLIDVMGGSEISKSALLAALDRGVPARAVLDVFHAEPLPADDPIWSHPRVRVSSHCSALGSRHPQRADELFLDNLGRFARGEPMRNVVKASDLPKTPEREA